MPTLPEALAAGARRPQGVETPERVARCPPGAPQAAEAAERDARARGPSSPGGGLSRSADSPSSDGRAPLRAAWRVEKGAQAAWRRAAAASWLLW